MVEPKTLEAPEIRYPERLTQEEEFGLVGGPLGHLTDQALDERFFNAAAWEQLAWDEAITAQHLPDTDLTLQL